MLLHLSNFQISKNQIMREIFFDQYLQTTSLTCYTNQQLVKNKEILTFSIAEAVASLKKK